jgi:hypothetical protein
MWVSVICAISMVESIAHLPAESHGTPSDRETPETGGRHLPS